MMHICGLQVIVMPDVPPSLRYGRRCVVLEPREAAELACALYRDPKLLADLLEGHENYLLGLEQAA